MPREAETAGCRIDGRPRDYGAAVS